MCPDARARLLGFCADPFIQKTKRLYVDTRTQRNLNKLNEDLVDVQKIMTQNIQESPEHPPRNTPRTPPENRLRI
mgnify:CR=1 FL=1